ncbi:unnamed protein product [Cuscuta campestris]|uniref:Uncharacterized protein n=1 Tax=Cuscuta campestris TaxID=132261 RepID=A0A484KWH9_9ASTE|nr:unnamed protein product [Cuscuta campestris]
MCYSRGIHGGEAGRDWPIKPIIRRVEHLESGAKLRYVPGETVVFEPELQEPRRGRQRRGNPPGKPVVRQVNFLQRTHAGKSIVADLPAKSVAGQEQRLERPQFPPVRHQPFKSVVLEAQKPEESQRREGIDVDVSGQTQPVELEAHYVSVQAEDAFPVPRVAGARAGRRVPRDQDPVHGGAVGG